MREEMVEEDRKYYPMMKAVHRREITPYSEVELLYGRDLLRRRHPVLRDFLLREERIRENILERLRRAGTPGAVQRQEDVERELARIREALGRYACQ